MSGTEFVVAPDRWSLGRGPRFSLRRNRILPGPLRALPRRRTTPAWIARLGIAGLAVAAALAIAPQFRAAAPSPASAPVEAARPAPVEPVRIIAAIPADAAPVARTEPVASPALRGVAEAVPAPQPAPARAPAPGLDVGQLPVLELDAAAFDGGTQPPAEAARAAKAPARTAIRRP